MLLTMIQFHRFKSVSIKSLFMIESAEPYNQKPVQSKTRTIENTDGK